MPADYRLRRAPALLVTTFTGTVTDEEFLDLYRRVFDDPGYELGTPEFADLRGVAHFGVSERGLRGVVALNERVYAGTGQSFQSAVVAADDVAYAVARIYEVYSGGSVERMRVYRTAVEALDALGVAEPALRDELDRPE